MRRFLSATLVAAYSLTVPGCSGGNDAPKQSGNGSCNSVLQRGSPVTSTCSADSAPAMTGGAILDGTYVLSADTNYDCTVQPAAFSQAVTLVISGSTLNSAIECNGCSPSMNSTFSLAGSQLSMTTTCPANVSPTTTTYTATESGLSVLFGNHLLQYGKL